MMHGLRNPKVWALVTVASLISVPLAAQPPAPPAQAPAAPAATTPAARAADPLAPVAGQMPPVDKYVVGTAVPEVVPGTTMMNLTLEQAMQMALDANLDLKAARMNPQVVDYQLASARAAFMPQLSGTYQYQDQTQLNNDINYLVPNFVNKVGTYNASVTKTMPWFGGRLTGSFANTKTASTNPRSSPNPTFRANGQFQYTQPLLQGLRFDTTRNLVRTLSAQRSVVDLQLTATIENTKANVRTAYWNLRQAIEQIEIERRSLDLANRLYQDNKTKVEIGTLAPIETTTSETQVANGEQALLAAQVQWRTAELTLKRLLAGGPDDDVYKATINPTEVPALSVQSVDIPAAVQQAMANRTDLVEARRNLDINRMTLQVTQDLLRPQLNLTAGYNVAGQNAVLTDSTGQPVLNPDGTAAVSGYGTAFTQAFNLSQPTWNVQFNFTYPLFMRGAKADFARAQLQIDQSVASLKAQELTVTADVTNAGLNVENTYKQYQAAQKAREVADRNAAAEQTRFDVGMSTNYNVVQAQDNLTTQRLAELSALIKYVDAVAEFDRIQRVGQQ